MLIGGIDHISVATSLAQLKSVWCWLSLAITSWHKAYIDLKWFTVWKGRRVWQKVRTTWKKPTNPEWKAKLYFLHLSSWSSAPEEKLGALSWPISSAYTVSRLQRLIRQKGSKGLSLYCHKERHLHHWFISNVAIYFIVKPLEQFNIAWPG